MSVIVPKVFAPSRLSLDDTFVSAENYAVVKRDRIRSCLLNNFTRKIKITVNRRFDISNIILKIEVVYANVKVSVMRELKILNI